MDPRHAMGESHRHDAILNKKYASQDITYCWSRVSTRGCGDSSLGKLCGAQARGSKFSFSALTLKNLGMVVYACYPSARRTRICRVYEFSDKLLYQKQGSKHSVRCLVSHMRGERCRGTISQHQHLDLSSLASYQYACSRAHTKQNCPSKAHVWPQSSAAAPVLGDSGTLGGSS